MNILKARPPKGKTKEEIENEFIEAADQRQDVNGNDPLPWEQPGIREDLIKGFNFRINEPYLLKLRFIAENTPFSMQKFAQKILFPAIDKEVQKILESK